ncbi:MAG: YitT family protein [Candidatus Kapabacteria bacterium]|jgi:uncharacterized membrane-anchored protein YitT (DUF2179 family)|nr:YitT family protein [Candidatus Kapabacteria bacterium]
MGKIEFNRQSITEYIFIGLGSAVMALGIGVFLVDAQVVPGGVSGLSMAIYYLSGETLPVGLLIWVLNVPLYIWGVKVLGKRFGVRTFYAFSINSFFIDFFRGDIPGFNFIRLQELETITNLQQNDFFFLVLLGAILMGVGLGIIFKYKGTTAGSDIVAAIMQKKYGMKPGQAIMYIDFFVILAAGLIIGLKGLSPDKPALLLTLYALFLLFLSSRIIDVIIDGFDYARGVFIISEKNKEISQTIIENLSRGATTFMSHGLYKNIEREVIMTVVTLKELAKLTELIKEIDPDAFVIVNNVHEVLGRGFKRRS